MVRVRTLEIAWHNVDKTNVRARRSRPRARAPSRRATNRRRRLIIICHLFAQKPIYSCDFNPRTGVLATAGADREIKLWRIAVTSSSTSTSVEEEDGDAWVTATHLETLTGHAKAVNCARWNARGDALAPVGDAGDVYVWRESEGGTNAHGDAVGWRPVKTLRGHADDATSACWGPKDALATSSVDNTVIVWDAVSGQGLVQLREHSHYVQGVAFDPRGEYVVTQSPDRTARVYAVTGGGRVDAKNIKQVKVIKCVDAPGEEGGQMPMFHDDSMTSFFRRPEWSPDGSFVALPAGMFRRPGAARAMNATYVFARGNFHVPAMHLPGGEAPSVCVRFNPRVFERREGEKKSPPLTDLRYRIIFAVASQDSVCIYDTDETEPICYVSGIHLASITDCAWSPDGRVLVVTSTDGFASVIAFDEDELGAAAENVRFDVPSANVSPVKPVPVEATPAVVAPVDAAQPTRIAPTRIAPTRIAPTPL